MSEQHIERVLKLLIAERQKKGITLNTISKSTGISLSTIQSWFSQSRKPNNISKLRILIDYFEIDEGTLECQDEASVDYEMWFIQLSLEEQRMIYEMSHFWKKKLQLF
ncbi:helix-turn-helix domain-containing protein [Dongshaea marina]|uniref:helix-turn-helix domain-containing protein n=1 Tax=Dongshaea marina TaxID=2047966 RepID=UPI000D3E7304|nr:helix-turn-helix transcriptional regulator [Dongshaea marina]